MLMTKQTSFLQLLRDGLKDTSGIYLSVLKKKLSLQGGLDLFQNLPSEISDALTDDSSGEEVPAIYLLAFSLDS
ncbi:hypothetical protein TNCV_3854761 [Trichonephila clavipes]|nr:hypothetical protein TNCV_3854761 [Trichonephila clavipes]